MAIAILVIIIAYFIIRPKVNPSGPELIQRKRFEIPVAYSSPGSISLSDARDASLGYSPSSNSSLNSVGSKSILGRLSG